MRILLDECMPERMPSGVLEGHEFVHVRELGWHAIKNGDLLRRANGVYDVLLTIDKNLPYQQTLKVLQICLAVFDIYQPARDAFAAHLRVLEPHLSSLLPCSFTLIRLE